MAAVDLPLKPKATTPIAASLQPFVCGGSAACFASMIIHPVDLIKVRMQVRVWMFEQPHSHSRTLLTLLCPLSLRCNVPCRLVPCRVVVGCATPCCVARGPRGFGRGARKGNAREGGRRRPVQRTLRVSYAPGHLRHCAYWAAPCFFTKAQGTYLARIIMVRLSGSCTACYRAPTNQ